MRIVGVRGGDQQVVWLHAGTLDLAPGDGVTFAVEGAERTGIVLIAPEQLLAQPPVAATGIVTSRRRVEDEEPPCDSLPGAHLPALGSFLETDHGSGLVTAIDPLRDEATVTLADGSTAVVPCVSLDHR